MRFSHEMLLQGFARLHQVQPLRGSMDTAMVQMAAKYLFVV